jgi:uncharacterized protein (TIGR02594 family)
VDVPCRYSRTTVRRVTVRTSAFAVAKRLEGIREIEGERDHPFIQWALMLCGFDDQVHDEVPSCGAFVGAVAFVLGLPRSRSASARSWLNVGRAISLAEAEPGNDIVILKRGTGPQPGPEVTSGAAGHVGFFAGAAPDGRVLILGGNQGNSVSIAAYDRDQVLGVRRLA